MSRQSILVPTLICLSIISLSACGGGGGGGVTPAAALSFRITGIFPPNGSQTFDPAGKIIVTFSDSLASFAEADENLVVSHRESGQIVSSEITLTVANQVATLLPNPVLDSETWYTLRVRGGMRSVGSQTLGDDYVTHFRTTDGGGTPPPPPPPPAGGQLRLVGNMEIGRSSHVAVLLNDGRVLVAGGFDTANSVTATAELYDPASEAFSRTGVNMVLDRGFHAGVKLASGNILITGGVTGAVFGETGIAEIYSTSTRTFGGAGTMNSARAFHTMTLLNDGRVLIAGGTVPGPSGSFSSRKAETYNPSDGSYRPLPDMSVYRASHTATLLPDGKVFLAGGNGTDKRGEVFDPTTDTFSLVGGQMQSARRGHSATHIKDGVVLLMGGGTRTADLYVPSQNLFRPANSYPLYDRKEHTASWTQSGRLFFTGGSYISGNVLFFSLTTEYYEPRSGTFSPSQLMLDTPKTRHRATELSDGRILITGGANLDSTKPELRAALLYEED